MEEVSRLAASNQALAPAVRRLEETVGRTPLLAIRRLATHLPGIELYAKAEWLNPGGSVKDRAALEMLLEGERTGALRHGKSILEATSGNTGISLAMLGAARGYPVRLCLPATASPERKRILRAYRAEVIETDRLEGTDGAIRKARELVQAMRHCELNMSRAPRACPPPY